MIKTILSDVFIGNFRVTQKFGVNPKNYAKFGLKGHNGIDWATPDGTQIVATSDGEVIKSRAEKDANDKYSGYGEYVELLHWLKEPFDLWDKKVYGFATLYAHFRKREVQVGDKVIRGQLIGFADNTGNSTGNHLHFGFCYVDKNGLKLFRDNGFDGWQDALNKESITWDIKNLTEPIRPQVIDPLKKLKEDLDTCNSKFLVTETVRKELSKKLFGGTDEVDWQRIHDGVVKIVKEIDDSQKEVDLANRLWTAIKNEVDGDYIYPTDETRLLGALQGLKSSVPEGKVLVDEKVYNMLKEKSKIENMSKSEVTAILIKKIFGKKIK